MSIAPVATYGGIVFPGLRPFRPEEKVLFFGREEHTDELLRRLDDNRLLAVMGLSGTGKSSMVFAGLVPALERGHLSGSGPCWRVALMRPGVDPLGALARSLEKSLGKSDERLGLLHSGRLGLQAASEQGRAAHENFLLVVDQFEEVFRFQRDRSNRAHEAAEFVGLLLAAAREYEPDHRFYTVITMRSDYLGECVRFPGFAEALNESQYLVPRMNREQLREAIEGPAALGGVQIEPAVLRDLLDTTTDQQDQLPVLQHLLMRMWGMRAGSQLTHREYELAGGWENSLNMHADSVWGGLSEFEQRVAKRIFQRLTEKGEENRESRRPTKLKELATVAGVAEQEALAVIDHLSRDECSFLISSDTEMNSESVIDIIHESLIRRWDRLKEWTEEEADSGEWYQRVEDRVRTRGALAESELALAIEAKRDGAWNAAWAERYRTSKWGIKPEFEEVSRFLEDAAELMESENRNQEKQRIQELRGIERGRLIQRWLRWLWIAIGIFSIVAGYAAFQTHQAQEQRKHAEQQRNIAQNAKESADQSRMEERRQAEIAKQAETAAEQAKIEAKVLRSSAQDTLAKVRIQKEELGRQKDELVQLDRKAWALKLASDSESTQDKTVSSLLAIESLRRAQTPQGYAALWASNSDILPYVVQQERLSPDTSTVSFSAGGRFLAMGTVDSFRIWDVQNRRQVALTKTGGYVKAVAVNADGNLVATFTDDQTVRIWDSPRGLEVMSFRLDGIVILLAFSVDSKMIAVASLDSKKAGEAVVWNIKTKVKVRSLKLNGPISSLAFSPSGTMLAAGGDSPAVLFDRASAVRLMNLQDGSEASELFLEEPVRAIAFSPDGRRLAAGSSDGTEVFDTQDGEELVRTRQDGFVSAVAFSPDGSLLATSVFDAVKGGSPVRVWDSVTGRELIRGQSLQSVKDLTFENNGHLAIIALSEEGQRFRLYRLPVNTSDVISEYCSRLDRNLTIKEWLQYLGDQPYEKTCQNLPKAKPPR